MTARQYTWEKVIDQLLPRVEFAAAQQAVTIHAGATEEPRVARRRTRKAEPSVG